MIRIMPASVVLAVATTLVAATAASGAEIQSSQSTQAVPSTQTRQMTRLGDQSSWSLDFRAKMEQTSVPAIEIHLTGGWTSTISAVRGGEYDAQLQLTDAHLAGDQGKAGLTASAASLSALEARLSRPFWVTYRNDGAMSSVHFFGDVSASDRNLLLMIATELQLVRPEPAEHKDEQDRAQRWTTQERDGAGEYTALYVAEGRDRILKRKLKYAFTDGVAGAPADALRISVEESNIAFVIGSDHEVRTIEGKDRVRMNLSPDKTQQLAAATEFHLSHLQTARALSLIGGLERASASVMESPIVTQSPDAKQVRAEADERLLQGYTSEGVLNSAFGKGPGMKDGAIAGQPDRLAALFRRRPETASEAVALLIKNGPRKMVTNALGAAGSPTATAALSKVAHDIALPENLRTDAILAFVQMKHPTVEAMQVPDDLVNIRSVSRSVQKASDIDWDGSKLSGADVTVQSAARMISGALARTGRAEHPAEADAIDRTLLGLYRGRNDAKDIGERINLLGALGNSAGSLVIPAIEAALSDPEVAVRAAAARALRLAAGPDADRHLAKAIVSDSDASVRADAIFATRFRHPMPSPLTDALLEAASTDESNFVRSDALAVLSQNLSGSRQVSNAVLRIADSDKDLGIRRQARNALAAFSVGKSEDQ